MMREFVDSAVERRPRAGAAKPGRARSRRTPALAFGAVLCLGAAELGAAAADAPPSPGPRPGALMLAQRIAPAPVERLRRIPEQAREGVMLPPDGRFVTIDRARFTLAPGALIRDLDNRIVLPAYVRGPARVRYLLDRNRQISQIWIVADQP